MEKHPPDDWTVTPSLPVQPHVISEIEWEVRVLAHLRRLRAERKRAILELTEDGIVLVFTLQKAGRVE